MQFPGTQKTGEKYRAGQDRTSTSRFRASERSFTRFSRFSSKLTVGHLNLRAVRIFRVNFCILTRIWSIPNCGDIRSEVRCWRQLLWQRITARKEFDQCIEFWFHPGTGFEWLPSRRSLGTCSRTFQRSIASSIWSRKRRFIVFWFFSSRMNRFSRTVTRAFSRSFIHFEWFRIIFAQIDKITSCREGTRRHNDMTPRHRQESSSPWVFCLAGALKLVVRSSMGHDYTSSTWTKSISIIKCISIPSIPIIWLFDNLMRHLIDLIDSLMIKTFLYLFEKFLQYFRSILLHFYSLLFQKYYIYIMF